MAVIRKEGGDHLVYEHEQLGILIAIEKANQSIIKKFWKKYKGKREVGKDTVKGFPFRFDEEQESLKIDFSAEGEFEVRLLRKFE